MILKRKNEDSKIYFQSNWTLSITNFMKTKILEDILHDLPPFKPDIFPPRKSSKKTRFVRTELSPSEVEALGEITGYSEEQIR